MPEPDGTTIAQAQDAVVKAPAMHGVGIFFLLAVAISWLGALVLQWIAVKAGLPDFGVLNRMAETTFELSTIAGRLLLPVPLVYLLTRLVDFGPSLAGLITALVVGGQTEFRTVLTRLFRWRLPLRWYALAYLLPLIFVLLVLGLHIILGESAIIGPSWNGLATIGQLFFWVLLIQTLLGGGLGEELGWRG